MESFPRASSRGFTLPLLGCFVCGSPLVLAQDFSLRVARSDQTYVDDILSGGLLGDVKGDLSFGLSTSATYDTNVFLQDHHEEEDFSVAIRPWLAYRSDPGGDAAYSIEARYSPTFRESYDHSSLDGTDHAAEVAFKFQGAKTTLLLFANYVSLTTSDRFAGGIVEGSVFSCGLSGSYQVAPRTNVSASVLYSTSDFDTAGQTGADVLTFQLNGLWQATERLKFGPALRHTITESGNIGTYRSWAVLARGHYLVGERIDLSASLGVEMTSVSGKSGDEFGLTGDLNASYQFNDRWSFRGSVRYATIPSPSDLNYLVNDLSFSAAFIRNLNRGQLTAGVTLSFSEFDESGPVTVTHKDEENLSAFIHLRREFFSDRVMWDSTIRYILNHGESDWNQWMFTTGFTVTF